MRKRRNVTCYVSSANRLGLEASYLAAMQNCSGVYCLFAESVAKNVMALASGLQTEYDPFP